MKKKVVLLKVKVSVAVTMVRRLVVVMMGKELVDQLRKLEY